MTTWMSAIALLSSALGGAILGALIGAAGERRRIRRRCYHAAHWLQQWFGSAYTISAMSRRIAAGHDYGSDRNWRVSLQRRLEAIYLSRRSG